MKKVLNKHQEHVGYIIGEGHFIGDITVHKCLHDKDNWYITIKRFNILSRLLCKKTCTEQEIARYINVVLHEELAALNGLIKQITPFTATQ